MNRIAIAKETLDISRIGRYKTEDNSEIIIQKTDYSDDIEYRYSDDIGKYKTDFKVQNLGIRLDYAHKNNRPVYLVTDKGTFENIPFDSDKDYVVLNFASTKYPGGGFETGAMAQEEDLCYKSNLAFALKKHTGFYEYNKRNTNNGLYTDGIIYTKDVTIFRNSMMQLVKPRTCSVITSAAPNKKAALRLFVKANIINDIMVRRIEDVLKVAIVNGHKNIILGAWGCGVFGHSAFDVARAFKTVLVTKGYEYYFDEIIFGIKCNKQELDNYNTFKNVFRT